MCSYSGKTRLLTLSRAVVLSLVIRTPKWPAPPPPRRRISYGYVQSNRGDTIGSLDNGTRPNTKPRRHHSQIRLAAPCGYIVHHNENTNTFPALCASQQPSQQAGYREQYDDSTARNC